MELLIDNSAINLLHCKRLTQLTVIQGLDPGKKETETGSAGHTMVEHMYKTGGDIDKATEITRAKHIGVDMGKVLMGASMYTSAMKLPPAVVINGEPAIEYKFSFEYGCFVPPNSSEMIIVKLCGTTDYIYIDTSREELVVVDYKWSAAVEPRHRDSIMAPYNMASQLPFYIFALLWLAKKGTLPAVVIELLLAGKYRTEIHFVFFNCSPAIVRKIERGSFSDAFINRSFPLMVNNKIKDIIDIALLKDAAMTDGMTVYGACNKCPFCPACADVGTEREVEYLSRIPRRIYNPMTFR